VQTQSQAESDHLNRKLSHDFRAREFICFCCKKEGIKDDMVFHLQMAHDLLPGHRVIIINSAYRCEKHNKEAGGKETSSHIKGLAADIKCDDSSYRFLLISALIKAGFKRVGIGKNFIHVDLDTDKPQNLMWAYYD